MYYFNRILDLMVTIANFNKTLKVFSRLCKLQFYDLTSVYACQLIHSTVINSLQVNKLVRCLKLMIEYVMECDEEYMEERAIPPHGK